nr:hypothetical protein GCM10020093_088340 [Planobispora longispora]
MLGAALGNRAVGQDPDPLPGPQPVGLELDLDVGARGADRDTAGVGVPVGFELASAVHPTVPTRTVTPRAPRTATRLTLGTVVLHFALRPTTLARHDFPPVPIKHGQTSKSRSSSVMI